VSSLTVGDYPIVATASGDQNFLSSASAPLDQIVQKAATTTTLSSSSNPIAPGTSVRLTAIVSVDAPGQGTVGGTGYTASVSNVLTHVINETGTPPAGEDGGAVTARPDAGGFGFDAGLPTGAAADSSGACGCRVVGSGDLRGPSGLAALAASLAASVLAFRRRRRS
jgi:hypothetical protein